MENPDFKIEFIPTHHLKWFPVQDPPVDAVLSIIPGKPDGINSPIDQYFVLRQWWNMVQKLAHITVEMHDGEWRDIEVDWKNENKPPY